MKKLFRYLPLVLLTTLFAACGGGGGGGGDTVSETGTGISTGVLVDPYIVGAQLEEVGPDGQPIQPRSAVTSATGGFEFEDEITDGSIIRIKAGAEGQHAGVPFTGVLKRQVSIGDTAPVVVSPLTTLVANGMNPGAVVQMMSGAGFSGLTAERIFEDPMAGLVGLTGNVSDADLALLQANLATHAFMAANDDFNYGGVTTAAVTPVAFADCAIAVRNIINQTIYQQLAVSLGADFTVGDMANAAVRVTRIVVDGIREEVAGGNQNVSSAIVDQLTANAKMDTETIAGNFYQSRTGGDDSTPPSANPAVGESLFASNCLGCHSVANPPSSGGLNSQFAGGSSHNGRNLTESQIADVAAYLDSLSSGTPPTTDPGTNPGTDPGTVGDTTVGESLFSSNCLLCHSVANPPPSSGLDARFGGGSSHNGRSLTASEIADVAAYLDSLNSGTPPTTDPGTDPVACGTCHGLPPNGDIVPAGAHAVHVALNGVDCDSCHANNTHQNGSVELNFPAEWDSANGVATDNGDGTCSNIICHGGERTPDWYSGSISVASQCRSCHAYGNSEFNSYSSGEHRKHVNDKNIDCQTCHDPDKLASIGHFTNLRTPDFEADPAASLQDSLNFDSRQTCTTRCHDRGEGSW